jgi:hypothetical protein
VVLVLTDQIRGRFGGEQRYEMYETVVLKVKTEVIARDHRGGEVVLLVVTRIFSTLR